MKRYWSFVFLSLSISASFAQTGISVSTPRVYFQGNPGQTISEKIVIKNVSEKSEMELALSLSDWTYSETGENIVLPPDSLPISFTDWVSITEGSYFLLKPGEEKELTINVTVPQALSSAINVNTALLFVSQMNPSEDVDSEGTNIKISVRSGVKLYFRPAKTARKSLEITGLSFDFVQKNLQLTFDNSGNIWTDGTINTDLLNTSTGESTRIPEIVFYTLPGMKRISRIQLPQDLKKGNYVATVLLNYGDDTEIQAAELSFSYE